MTTLTSTPVMQQTAIVRQLLTQLTDICHRGPRYPTDLEDSMLWSIARYGNSAEFWRMAMIQLMVRARLAGDIACWHRIGAYLIEEASPAQLDEGVLWHFRTHAPVPWMVRRIDQIRAKQHRQEFEQAA